MRYLFIIISIILQNISVNGQISEGGLPVSFYKSDINLTFTSVTLPEINIKQLFHEDTLESINKIVPFRFGKDIDVNLSIDNSGTWQTLDNGDRIWQLGIHSKGAFSLNFIFNKFKLPENSKLFIYNSDKTSVLGAFTCKNNRDDGVFATSIINGDFAILEYYETANVKSKVILQLSKVIHAYKDLFKLTKNYNESDPCNINVNCPEGLPWQNEKRAVAMILGNNNTRICSGALLNNVRRDGTPYFLTANHCVVGEDVNTWVFIFNYESPDCSNQNGPLNQTIQGAVLRATDTPSDFALLELSSPPPVNYNIYFAGWSASDIPSDSCTVIHHPKGDIQKISFEDSTLVSTSWISEIDKTTWEVPFYTKGSTQEGSSGAPLFDKYHRIIGQLYGGPASCTNIDDDFYGKFAYSWDKGYYNYTRLKDWLDPDNTGTLVLNGKDFNKPAYNLDAALSAIITPDNIDICSDSITPEIIIKNNGSHPLTTAVIYYKIDNGTLYKYNWKGSLDYLNVKSIKLNPVSFSKGNHKFVVYITNPNDSIDSNHSNDTSSVFFNSIAGKNIIVTLYPDFYVSEIKWIIKDSQDNTLYSNPFLNSKKLYTTEQCLPEGCYTFTIFDSAGDGMCETTGSDSAYVSLSDGNILLGRVNGCNYTASYSIPFCVKNNGIIINKSIDNSLQIFPNPTTGELNLDYTSANHKPGNGYVYSASGKLISNFKIYDNIRLNLGFSDLQDGIYFITVQNDEVIYNKKFIILK